MEDRDLFPARALCCPFFGRFPFRPIHSIVKGGLWRRFLFRVIRFLKPGFAPAEVKRPRTRRSIPLFKRDY